MEAYLVSTAHRPILEATSTVVDGFESSVGLELLATVDWLIARQGIEATVPAVRAGIAAWPESESAAQRKAGLFDDRSIAIALQRLSTVGLVAGGASSPS